MLSGLDNSSWQQQLAVRLDQHDFSDCTVFSLLCVIHLNHNFFYRKDLSFYTCLSSFRAFLLENLIIIPKVLWIILCVFVSICFKVE